jgi:hypothetical protein
MIRFLNINGGRVSLGIMPGVMQYPNQSIGHDPSGGQIRPGESGDEHQARHSGQRFLTGSPTTATCFCRMTASATEPTHRNPRQRPLAIGGRPRRKEPEAAQPCERAADQSQERAGRKLDRSRLERRAIRYRISPHVVSQLKRSESEGAWRANPTSTKPTEVSFTRTTFAGYHRAPTGSA